MELSGRWVATAADDDVRRFGLGLDGDDSDWTPIDVPGHWRDTPAFGDSDGPIMYRHRFSAPPPTDGRRRWVTFDGIFYQADAWLDGAYLGDPEGYFWPHSYDVTALSRIGDDHVLAVEVACAPQDPSGRTNLTGVLQAWDGLPPDWNPGGIWRPVHLYDTGPVRVDRFRVLCRDADERRAHLVVTALLDSDEAREVTVRTLLDGEVVDEQSPSIAPGENELAWTIDIDEPALWWPRDLGPQTLTTVEIEVGVDGVVSDHRHRVTGLRQVDWSDWTCSVNGERLHVRGANLFPAAVGLAHATPQRIERDLDDTIELGLNAVRVHGHIAARHLYAEADRRGLVVLQDFPLERTVARFARARAVKQATAAVDLLGHHPSILMWSAHNEPTHVGAGLGDAPQGRSWRSRVRRAASQQLPSWNKTVLDRWVKRSFERADPTRLVVAHSGVAPHLPQLDGTDSHLWFGWKYGEADDLARRARILPRTVRFVSEFGPDSVPTTAPYFDDALATTEWPDLDWDRLRHDHAYQRDLFEAIFPPGDFDSFESWRTTTQYYQAHVLKVQIEALRRLKYRPNGGFCIARLSDPAPVVSASIVDHAGVRKVAFETVRGACSPVIVVADQLPDWVNPGDDLRLDVHLVNDRREPIDHTVVDAVASWAGGEQRWRFGGPIGADDVVRVGTLRLAVPDTLGELAIALRAVTGTETVATNRYTTAVTVPPSG